MTEAQRNRVSEFGAFIRSAFIPPREIGRVEKHLLICDLNDLWRWVYAHPETLAGPFPTEATR